MEFGAPKSLATFFTLNIDILKCDIGITGYNEVLSVLYTSEVERGGSVKVPGVEELPHHLLAVLLPRPEDVQHGDGAGGRVVEHVAPDNVPTLAL